MAATGSILSFFSPDSTRPNVNVVLSDSVGNPIGPTVASAFNVEVFINPSLDKQGEPTVAGSLAAGFDAGAGIQGAQYVSGALTTFSGHQIFYAVQAAEPGSQEFMFSGSSGYTMLDQTGGEGIGVKGSNQSIIGAAGDALRGDVSSFIGGEEINALASSISVLIPCGPGSAVLVGPNDTVGPIFGNVAGGYSAASSSQIVGDGGPGSSIELPFQGSYTVTGAANDTITAAGDVDVQLLNSGKNSLVDMTRSHGPANLAGVGGDTIIVIDNATITGSAGDSIVGGVNGKEQIFGNRGGMTIVAGASGGATTIQSGAADLIRGAVGSGTIQVRGVNGDTIDLSATGGADTIIGFDPAGGGESIVGGNGPATTIIYGGPGDTIAGGAGPVYLDGRLGPLRFKLGTAAGALDNIIGSSVAGSGDTVTAGAADLNYNPGGLTAGNLAGTTVGGGAYIDLSGGRGNATVNAFRSGKVDLAQPNDTILAGNGADSVWGGNGDRIGAGSIVGGAGPSGTALFDHSTTIPGAVIGFGTFDATTAATYGTTPGAVTVSFVAGASTERITVSGFKEIAGVPQDYLFYQSESAATTGAIVATASGTTVGGAASTLIVLPDGTQMTLLGLPVADLTAGGAAFFRP